MEEPNGNAEIRLLGLEYSFPVQADFDDIDTANPDGSETRTSVWAPWFDKRAVVSDEIYGELDVCTDEAGYFPSYIHQDNLDRWAWHRAFCVREDELAVPKDWLPRSVGEGFVGLTI